jgi:hypothetical protein
MSPSGRSSGNRITSRMDCEFVSSMVSRSMPSLRRPSAACRKPGAHVILVHLVRFFVAALAHGSCRRSGGAAPADRSARYMRCRSPCRLRKISKRSTNAGSLRLVLRKRRDLHRKIVNDGRLDQLPLHVAARKVAPAPRRRGLPGLFFQPRRIAQSSDDRPPSIRSPLRADVAEIELALRTPRRRRPWHRWPTCFSTPP